LPTLSLAKLMATAPLAAPLASRTTAPMHVMPRAVSSSSTA
jgi:hypothetical protein